MSRSSTSFAPVSRIALSKALRPPDMITSFLRPVVSGSCQMSLSSVPAMHPAVETAMAPAAPEVIIPDSAPVSSANRRPMRTLQIQHIHEILSRFDLRFAYFRKLQRPTQVGPGAAAIDDGLYPQAAITFCRGSLPTAVAALA